MPALPTVSGRPSFVVAALTFGLLLAGCGQNSARQYARPAQQVTIVTLKPQPVPLTRELPGRTAAYLVAEVRPQVSGIVKQRLFTEGAFVKTGQPLYELDDAPYRAQYNNAKAALQKAEATVEAAGTTARRDADLVKIDAVSQQDNDNAVAAWRQAQADVVAAQAAVDSAAVNLAYAHIVSPITGRIGKSSVTQGALVTQNQTDAMATVQQLDPIYVDVNQSSSEWLQLRQEVDSGRVQGGGAGAAAKIMLENGTEYGHEGKLQFADVTVDPTTGELLLRAIVPNPDHILMPGMYVRAIIREGVVTNGLLAPQQGIARDPRGNATALVVNAQNKVEAREVRVARTIGDQWLVEGGLSAGDRLIVEGVQKVQPGMQVQTVEQAVAGASGETAPVAVATAQR
ncbi:MAG TPA: efflux RND transporter periplasmic adaptor subunit [Steroidobacteraceae bacterium]|jgi:membrane fusion protein (multidrug efflux system)|nr:efflux RND transporter periplasmic adaptor subunit [Steroidobacteraceae bacterium]